MSRMSFRFATGAVAIVALAACGGSSKTASGGTGTGASTAASSSTSSNGEVSGTSGTFDACHAITPAELSQAVGDVTYASIVATVAGNDSLCTVTGTQTQDGFTYDVSKEDGALHTWAVQTRTIQEDDSTLTDVSGVGDKAAEGIKEFATESKGYIISIDEADFNNAATAKTFDRSKKIALLLISKLP